MVYPLWGNTVVDEDIDDVLDGEVWRLTRIESGPVYSIGWPSLGHKRRLRVSAIMLDEGLPIASG